MAGRLTRHAVTDLKVEFDPSMGAIVGSLTAAVDAKDPDTGTHLYRSAMLAKACLGMLAPEMERSEHVTYGFVLHDVGKIGVPETILNKPGPLNGSEWEVMRRHPQIGLDIVAPLGMTRLTTDVIIAHHERWDGRGYPFGLSGEDIPFVARVFAVADAYDALTAPRPYRAALAPQLALKWLRSEAGKSFDPTVVGAFLEVVGRRAA